MMATVLMGRAEYRITVIFEDLLTFPLGEVRNGIEGLKDHQRREKLRVWLEHDLPEWFEGRVLAVDLPVADRSLALWAADCAERVLPYFEEKYPRDDRPRKAIEAARAWARGEIRVGSGARRRHR